jgi:hypothetical protein
MLSKRRVLATRQAYESYLNRVDQILSRPLHQQESGQPAPTFAQVIEHRKQGIGSIGQGPSAVRCQQTRL